MAAPSSLISRLVQLLRHCECRLNGEAKQDLQWYDSKRPKQVSGRSLFGQYARALLVSGIGADQADSWMYRVNFSKVFTLENCKRYPAKVLLRRVQANPNNKWGWKLTEIHTLGRRLAGLTRREVANAFFGGTIRSSRLGEANGPDLDELPLIGPPSARFIIRNMGGELIKDDRWLRAIAKYFKCQNSDLEHAGRKIGWKLGRVDLLIWWYCKQEIRSGKKLAAHFRSLGFMPLPKSHSFGR